MILRLAAGIAVALVAACAGPAQSTPPSVLGSWRIDQAQREPIVDRRLVRLDFGADGRLTGHGSCNRLGAAYTLHGDTLKVGPIITTKMACEPLLMEQEDRILSALEKAATARVRPDGLLEIRDVDGRGVLRGSRFEARN